MHPVNVITTILGILVVFGVAGMVLANPKSTNSLLASGTSFITHTTNVLKNG
jgi:hypothetical protein